MIQSQRGAGGPEGRPEQVRPARWTRQGSRGRGSCLPHPSQLRARPGLLEAGGRESGATPAPDSGRRAFEGRHADPGPATASARSCGGAGVPRPARSPPLCLPPQHMAGPWDFSPPSRSPGGESLRPLPGRPRRRRCATGGLSRRRGSQPAGCRLPSGRLRSRPLSTSRPPARKRGQPTSPTLAWLQVSPSAGSRVARLPLCQRWGPRAGRSWVSVCVSVKRDQVSPAFSGR